MKTGTIYVKKDVASVFAFISSAENLYKQIPDKDIDDYEIELEDNLKGELKLGQEISVFINGKYEGMKDFVNDIQIIGSIRVSQRFFTSLGQIFSDLSLCFSFLIKNYYCCAAGTRSWQRGQHGGVWSKGELVWSTCG